MPELTPDERQKIYLEEKVKLETAALLHRKAVKRKRTRRVTTTLAVIGVLVVIASLATLLRSGQTRLPSAASAPADPVGESDILIAKPNCEIRSGPGPGYLVLDRPTSGTRLDFGAYAPGWFRLRSDGTGIDRWVRATHVSASPENTLLAAEKAGVPLQPTEPPPEEAEKIREAAAKARAALRTKVDKLEAVIWYMDPGSPRYANANAFYVYFGEKSGVLTAGMRLKIQYHSDNWLFIQSFTVFADSERFDRQNVRFEGDNSSKVWEWYDEPATPQDMEMIMAVINSKDATIRFYGRQYQADRTITAKQKAALKNVITAYQAIFAAGGGAPTIPFR